MHGAQLKCDEVLLRKACFGRHASSSVSSYVLLRNLLHPSWSCAAGEPACLPFMISRSSDHSFGSLTGSIKSIVGSQVYDPVEAFVSIEGRCNKIRRTCPSSHSRRSRHNPARIVAPSSTEIGGGESTVSVQRCISPVGCSYPMS